MRDDWKRHFKQAGMFVAVGMAQVALDTVVFIVATALGAPVAPAKVLSRASGACLGFLLNGRYTFSEGGPARNTPQHLGRFVLAWSLLTSISTFIIHTIAQNKSLQGAWIANPLVEGGMAVIGFFVWRHWVFVKR
ncbi:GtrA family protein [Arenimonas sp.]|uniref:GtrA family protein n=1 Tax=Arenimonas sp. TaxID=1872635 RepID=UPI0039E6F489